MRMEDASRQAVRVSVVSIAVNLALSAGKLAAGLIAHSGEMISDAIHSASDVFSTFIVIIGLKLSGKAPDREHPYGHERMECVAAIVLAVVLLLTGLLIGRAGVLQILSGQGEALPMPGVLALAAAVGGFAAAALFPQVMPVVTFFVPAFVVWYMSRTCVKRFRKFDGSLEEEQEDAARDKPPQNDVETMELN